VKLLHKQIEDDEEKRRGTPCLLYGDIPELHVGSAYLAGIAKSLYLNAA